MAKKKSWWSRAFGGDWDDAWRAWFGQPQILEPDPPPPPVPIDENAGRLEQDQMEDIVRKRMARLGRYYTSPTGVLGNANTGSTKVFS